MWKEGNITIDGVEFKYQAKVFQEPSKFGIGGGKISKLEVTRDLHDNRWHQELNILQYDRGWVYKSDDVLAKKVLTYILNLYN